jgi:hypothetical protein
MVTLLIGSASIHRATKLLLVSIHSIILLSDHERQGVRLQRAPLRRRAGENLLPKIRSQVKLAAFVAKRPRTKETQIDRMRGRGLIQMQGVNSKAAAAAGVSAGGGEPRRQSELDEAT